MTPKKKSTKAHAEKRSKNSCPNAATFRKLARSFPGAVEQRHMNHPDFRMNGKIFATLAYPNDDWGMVKLTPEQQAEFIQAEPRAFTPCKGAWGRQGSTSVNLGLVTEQTLRRALEAAWRKVQCASKTSN